MFDSIMIDIECPYCNETSLIECQTKELECTLQVWHKEDNIGESTITNLDCIAGCHSKKCMDFKEKYVGYRSGFGRTFFVDVAIYKGVITGEYKITKHD